MPLWDLTDTTERTSCLGRSVQRSWENYAESSSSVEASREWETHLPIFQCLASSENMIDAQYIFINRVNESINDQTMHKWFRLERTGKWVRKPWWFCFALKLSKGMVPIANKKNKTCDRSLYLSICFGGLKQFLSKYNKWKECCLCKWNTKKKTARNKLFICARNQSVTLQRSKAEDSLNPVRPLSDISSLSIAILSPDFIYHKGFHFTSRSTTKFFSNFSKQAILIP